MGIDHWGNEVIATRYREMKLELIRLRQLANLTESAQTNDARTLGSGSESLNEAGIVLSLRDGIIRATGEHNKTKRGRVYFVCSFASSSLLSPSSSSSFKFDTA
jgi:hypothetical protein